MEKKVEKVYDKIENIIVDMCSKCPNREKCIEEKCPFFRIETILEDLL